MYQFLLVETTFSHLTLLLLLFNVCHISSLNRMASITGQSVLFLSHSNRQHRCFVTSGVFVAPCVVLRFLLSVHVMNELAV